MLPQLKPITSLVHQLVNPACGALHHRHSPIQSAEGCKQMQVKCACNWHKQQQPCLKPSRMAHEGKALLLCPWSTTCLLCHNRCSDPSCTHTSLCLLATCVCVEYGTAATLCMLPLVKTQATSWHPDMHVPMQHAHVAEHHKRRGAAYLIEKAGCSREPLPSRMPWFTDVGQCTTAPLSSWNRSQHLSHPPCPSPLPPPTSPCLQPTLNLFPNYVQGYMWRLSASLPYHVAEGHHWQVTAIGLWAGYAVFAPL